MTIRTATAAAPIADPRLHGAACTGRWPLFDLGIDDETDDERNYRHVAAWKLCLACPVRPLCRTVANELGPLATGVWGGEKRTAQRKRAAK